MIKRRTAVVIATAVAAACLGVAGVAQARIASDIPVSACDQRLVSYLHSPDRVEATFIVESRVEESSFSSTIEIDSAGVRVVWTQGALTLEVMFDQEANLGGAVYRFADAVTGEAAGIGPETAEAARREFWDAVAVTELGRSLASCSGAGAAQTDTDIPGPVSGVPGRLGSGLFTGPEALAGEEPASAAPMQAFGAVQNRTRDTISPEKCLAAVFGLNIALAAWIACEQSPRFELYCTFLEELVRAAARSVYRHCGDTGP